MPRKPASVPEPKAASRAQRPAAKPAKPARPTAAAKAVARPAAKAAPGKGSLKAAVKTAAKALAKPPARKPAAKPTVKAAAKATPRAPAPVRAPAQEVRPVLVRDSFTMPEQEYAVLQDVKQACLRAGIDVKKSELLRIGVALLGQLDVASLQGVLAALPQLKTGRPPAQD